MTMAQLTVRGVPEDVKKYLERRAKQEGLSVNRVVLDGLRQMARTDEERARRRKALQRFVGMWTHEEAEEVRQRLADTEQIEEEMWR